MSWGRRPDRCSRLGFSRAGSERTREAAAADRTGECSVPCSLLLPSSSHPSSFPSLALPSHHYFPSLSSLLSLPRSFCFSLIHNATSTILKVSARPSIITRTSPTLVTPTEKNPVRDENQREGRSAHARRESNAIHRRTETNKNTWRETWNNFDLKIKTFKWLVIIFCFLRYTKCWGTMSRFINRSNVTSMFAYLKQKQEKIVRSQSFSNAKQNVIKKWTAGKNYVRNFII